MRSMAIFSALCLILLSGCPAQFPDCPPVPTLDYVLPDPSIVGAWQGEAGYYSDLSFIKIYTVGLALNADRTFLLNIHDDSGRYTANGTWAVDSLASPQPRIQLGVACSDSERHPESSWHRGVYYLQVGDEVTSDFLHIDTHKYPDSAVIDSDFTGVVWRFFRQ